MSIIAISGRKNSGKDLVGKIIQYLLIDWNKVVENYDIKKPLTFEQYQNSAFNGENLSGWEIKKFAGKVNEAYKIITGVDFLSLPREEKELQRADFIKFAEWVKEIFGDDVWIKGLMREYKPNYFGGIDTYDEKGNHISKPIKIGSDWVITDLRRKNELKAVKEKGGITIRVNRNIFKYNDDISYVTNPIFETEQHISETELDNETFDYYIDNNGTVEELIDKIKEILIKEKLL